MHEPFDPRRQKCFRGLFAKYRMQEPRWLTSARKLVGVREVPGTQNSATIMGWAKSVGTKMLGIAYNADSVPWCGLFVAHVMTSVGIKPPAIAVRASSWDRFGIPVGRPYLGAIARFERKGGGHVAIITGQSAGHLRVLGGNQSDAVNETWIEKSRCVAMRWPVNEPCFGILAPIAKVGSVSTNEA